MGNKGKIKAEMNMVGGIKLERFSYKGLCKMSFIHLKRKNYAFFKYISQNDVGLYYAPNHSVLECTYHLNGQLSHSSDINFAASW